MISVLLIWLYIALTAGIVGKTVLAVFRCRPRTGVSCQLAGLVTVTVYAEFWSLFGGVGLAANLVLLAVCMAAVILSRRGQTRSVFFSEIRQRIQRVKRHPLGAAVITAAILLLALGTSAGNWHIDTPLYHAQSIHWIETYGLIPGLGNLQSDFAYNNACFSLYALYSFSWLTGQSFHAVQGFLAVLLMLLCLPVGESETGNTSAHRLRPADLLRLAALLQIVFLYDELVSPSSDSFILLLVHAVILLWARLSDTAHREASPVPYALVAMLAVYAVTVKLAAAPLLIFAVKPIFMLLKGSEKNLRVFGRFVLTALVIVLPFFARGILISGWLLYPVFPLHAGLPWKIPDGVGISESFEIRQNGRMIFDMSQADTSLFGWVKGWLTGQSLKARLLIYAAAASVLFALLRALVSLILHLRGTKIRYFRDACSVFTEIVLAVCVLFWFFTTPQMRFGEAYLMDLSALVFGGLICAGTDRLRETARNRAERLISSVIIAVSVSMAALLFITGQVSCSQLFLQQDYERYSVGEYRIDGVTLYYPTDYVYTGYYAFPATRWKDENVRALGTKITDGFAAKE